MKKNLMIFLFLNILTKLFSSDIQILTKKGYAKENSVIYKDGVLTLDHIISPVCDIELCEDVQINKVIFNFVYFVETPEKFWNNLKNVSTVEFNFCTLDDLKFLNFLPNLEVLLFIESNEINNYSYIDFSNNRKLKEIILSNYKVNKLNIISDYIPNLDYFYIAHVNFDDESYSVLKEKIRPETIFIIDNKQEKYFNGYNYILNDKFDFWNRKIIK